MNGLQENIRLASLTTLGIGGCARYFVEASSEVEVAEAVGFARAERLRLLVLGGGSNLLISDEGFGGLVLRVRIGGMTFAETGRGIAVKAGAGVDWDLLVADCVDRGLAGLECLSGIPGWVGGTPVQNVGAYGQEVSEVISNVRVFDLSTGAIVDVEPARCGFSYRTSVFNSGERGRYIVLAVAYELEKRGPAAIEYPDLERFFEGRDSMTLSEVRRAVLEIRRSKAMLLVPGDPDCRSAGSFFKNPVVTGDETVRIESAVDEAVPRFPAGGGKVKVPAAWLIERAGFGKGTRRGRVGLSARHTLALVNRGGASSADVVEFAGEIQERVEERFGVRLRPEPVFAGFPEDVLDRLGALSA